MEKTDFFVPENADVSRRKEYLSPSGKYKLVLTPFKTQEGCWSYTQGLVYEGDRLITEVQRDYSSFPFAWIDPHVNGGSYLICGENYQGQTVI